MGAFAWVTLATNDSYSLGALVLAHSLKQAGTVHQLAVLVTPGVTSAMREKLLQVFNVVQEVNILDSRDEANLRLLKRPELGITFTKLHCWRLTQFEKCVFLDADTLVLQNSDELFEREELSAAPDVGWPDCFNSGVFVYRPSLDTFEKLVQFALEKGSFDGGDQGLLNLYFSDWAHKDISKHLPFIYNMCSTACYSYLPAFKQFGSNAKIMHFIGVQKPWLQYFNTETKKVQPSGDSTHLQEVLQRWWDIFCSLIHPHLSPAMAGLAAAFSQLTLGVPRTAEQDALENVLRKQAWEVGNIDYLGKDSFENIWEKISQTLSSAPAQGPAPQEPQPAPAESQSQTAPQEEAVQPPPETIIDKSSSIESPKVDSSESSPPEVQKEITPVSPATQPPSEQITTKIEAEEIKKPEEPVKELVAPVTEQKPEQKEEALVKAQPETIQEEPTSEAIKEVVPEPVKEAVAVVEEQSSLKESAPIEPPTSETVTPKEAVAEEKISTPEATPKEISSEAPAYPLPSKEPPQEPKELPACPLPSKEPPQDPKELPACPLPSKTEPPKVESTEVKQPEPLPAKQESPLAIKEKPKDSEATPKTKVTEPTPPTTPSTPPLEKTKQALSAEAAVPETPPPSEGGSTPTPPPRKTDKPKKAATKPKK